MAITSRPLPTRDRAGPLAPRRSPKTHVPLALVAYALALLALVVLVQTLVTVAQRCLDDLRYGMPRRMLVQGIVGHDDGDGMPSTLQALNMAGQIVLIELPGSDPGRAVVLPAPFVIGADGVYVVPRLALHDVNGDSHVDLLLTSASATPILPDSWARSITRSCRPSLNRCAGSCARLRRNGSTGRLDGRLIGHWRGMRTS